MFIKYFAVSLSLHIVIIAVLAIITFANHKQVIISINTVSSSSITFLQQPNLKKVEKQLELADQKNISKVQINTTKNKNKIKKETQANLIKQKSLSGIGNLDDEMTVKTVIKDQSLLEYKTPTYPKQALRNKQQGLVIVRMLLSNTGKIQKVVIYQSSGYSLLDKAVLDTVKYWEIPRNLQQSSWVEVKVNFIIK